MKHEIVPRRVKRRPKRDDQPSFKQYQSLYLEGTKKGFKNVITADAMKRCATLVQYKGENHCARCYLADFIETCLTYNNLCIYGYFRFIPDDHKVEMGGMSFDVYD